MSPARPLQVAAGEAEREVAERIAIAEHARATLAELRQLFPQKPQDDGPNKP
jgi:hypothetical protein